MMALTKKVMITVTIDPRESLLELKNISCLD